MASELTTLRKTLLAWLRTADAAGLDDAGMVALFTSALRDFCDRRGETSVPGTRDGGRSQAGDAAAQGVA